jgi:diacylglycerol O-acyltransferase / wax synthase
MESAANLMMITAVLGFDRLPDLDRLRARIERRFRDIPRLRQRVVSSWGRPRWVEAPRLDLDAHIRHSTLEHDSEAVLWDCVSRLMSTPLDRERPLWTVDAIAQPNGRGVLVARLHHSIGDGIALMLLLLSLTDMQPDPPQGEDNPLACLFAPGGADMRRVEAFAAKLLPGGVRLMQRDRRPARRIGPRIIARTFETALGLLFLPADPPSPLRGRLQPRKRAACSHPLSLSRIKSLAAKLDCTINDLMTAVVAGALRRHLTVEGRATPEDLRVAVPINLRRLEKMGELGNRFGLLFVPLPIEVEGRLERVAEVRRRIRTLASSLEPVVTYGILNLIVAAPRLLEDWVVDLFAKKVTAVMTNVPGPVRTLYLAGQPIRSLIFWVPQTARVGLGISVSSYAGQMWVGIAADAHLVEDPAAIIGYLHEELDALSADVDEAGASANAKGAI